MRLRLPNFTREATLPGIVWRFLLDTSLLVVCFVAFVGITRLLSYLSKTVENRSHQILLTRLEDLLFFSKWIVIVIFGLYLLFKTIRELVESLMPAKDPEAPSSLHKPISRKFAGESDISQLHAFYTQFFHHEVPSPDLMASWIRKCPECFTLLYSINATSLILTTQELVGSFKVLPLNSSAIKGLESEELSGTTLLPVHLESNPDRVKGYYVGDVAATSLSARGTVLNYLNFTCERALKSNLPIYGRPLTSDGLRVMTQYGFARVADGKSPPALEAMCVLKTSTAEVRNIKSKRRRQNNPE
jgi:hypothetical protein